jgi:hypothetical protein
MPDVFKVALETMRYEGTLLWQIFNAFLLIHSVMTAFLFQSVFAMQEAKWVTVTCLAATGGLALCVPWWASYLRNAAHYRYHLARARVLEPPEWHIYGGLGRDFSCGKKVTIDKETYHLPWLARRVRSGRMMPPVILLFTIVYISIIGYSGPWWRHKLSAAATTPKAQHVISTDQRGTHEQPGNYPHQ